MPQTECHALKITEIYSKPSYPVLTLSFTVDQRGLKIQIETHQGQNEKCDCVDLFYFPFLLLRVLMSVQHSPFLFKPQQDKTSPPLLAYSLPHYIHHWLPGVLMQLSSPQHF